MRIRAFPWWSCLHANAGVCADFQQPFTAYASLFYNAPAPAGYSLKKSS
ncbi:MAG: hypothetical protein ACT4PT_02940 [Methanobacteriota archaeon]